MGTDGAIEIKKLNLAGALTIAQSEENCAMYGMPMAAVKAGGINEILSLKKIIQRIIKTISTGPN